MQKVYFQDRGPIHSADLSWHDTALPLVTGTSLLSFGKVIANNGPVMIAHTSFGLNSDRQEYESVQTIHEHIQT